MATQKVQDGVVVSIAYTMLVDGEEFESLGADEPLDYLHGADNIVPGLEKALTGKQAGDKINVTLQPADAYGEYDEDDIDEIERDDFPDPSALVPGTEILLEHDDGMVVEAVIKEVNDDTVVIDYNDSLAGKVITYDVEIISMRPATEDERDQGYPEGVFDEDDDE